MDIRFYTLDFSDVRILPATSKENGYISMNSTIEFCGTGTFELVFYDKELEEFVEQHPEGLIITWGDFQGYFMDYQFQKEQNWVFGSHINSLLHKFVIPPQSISGDLKTVASEIITQYTPFIFIDSTEDFGTVEYTSDKYQSADAFFIDLLPKQKIGYRLFAKSGVIYFELLRAVTNPLMLSNGNRNVYEVQKDFSNKNVAYGGWYKKTKEDDGTELETEEWIYISTAEKEGIYKQDVVLNASTPSEAVSELAAKAIEYNIDCKTRNIEYGVDYSLGDIVRYQDKAMTVYKQISSVSLWLEGSTYHQEPTLTEWEGTDV